MPRGRPTILTPEEMDEMAERYGQGESGHSLASAFGIHPDTAYAMLHRQGVKMRSYAEAAAVREREGRGKCRIRRRA